MDAVKIGKFIGQLRKDAGLTQEQLGSEIGVSNKTISRWETGVYLPPVDMLLILCEKFHVSINELLSGERLDARQYKDKAEDNLRQVLKSSQFSTEVRVRFFNKRWIKRNLLWILLSVAVSIGLYIAGVLLDNGLQLPSVLMLIGWMIFWQGQRRDYLDQFK